MVEIFGVEINLIIRYKKNIPVLSKKVCGIREILLRQGFVRQRLILVKNINIKCHDPTKFPRNLLLLHSR